MTNSKKRSTGWNLDLIWLPLAAFLLILHNSIAEEAVRETLDLCARVLIPSLFPYMIISVLIIRSGAAEILGAPLAPVVRHLFRLPACSAGAVVLGILCGFPVGAQMAGELYIRGDLTKKEAERLIPLANCAGPAFVIEVVGGCLWNSREFGIFLYTVQLITAWIIAAVAARFTPKVKTEYRQTTSAVACSVPLCISEAVSTSALSMLKICGFIAFFSVLVSSVQNLFAFLKIPGVSVFIASLLEFTVGSKLAAETGGMIGAFLTGLTVGWSGLSVFSQCMTFTSPAGIRLRFALISKAVQGLLCGTASALFFPMYTAKTSVLCTASLTYDFPAWALYLEIILLVLFCIFPLLTSLRRNIKS